MYALFWVRPILQAKKNSHIVQSHTTSVTCTKVRLVPRQLYGQVEIVIGVFVPEFIDYISVETVGNG